MTLPCKTGTLKALTLLEPWGYAHVHLGKRVENRTWRISKGRYALHSGKGVDKAGAAFIDRMGYRIDWSKVVPGAVFAVCDIVRLVEITEWTVRHQGRSSSLRPERQIALDLEGGQAIIAEVLEATLVGIPEDQRKWAFGPWAHVYDPVTFRILPEPIPCKGALGLWDLPRDVEDRVREQIRTSSAPCVLNIHVHSHPWDSVFVGRGTKWGNPFTWKEGTLADFVVDKEEVLPRYESWLQSQRDLLRAMPDELRGRDLICYCAPRACHADILLRMANA